jgi:hypothetical protein
VLTTNDVIDLLIYKMSDSHTEALQKLIRNIEIDNIHKLYIGVLISSSSNLLNYWIKRKNLIDRYYRKPKIIKMKFNIIGKYYTNLPKDKQ